MDFLKKAGLYSRSLRKKGKKKKTSPNLAQASPLLQRPPQPYLPLQVSAPPPHPHYDTFIVMERADPDPGQLRDSHVTTEDQGIGYPPTCQGRISCYAFLEPCLHRGPESEVALWAVDGRETCWLSQEAEKHPGLPGGPSW